MAERSLQLWAVPAWVVLLMVAVSPTVAASVWTPKAALLLPVGLGAAAAGAATLRHRRSSTEAFLVAWVCLVAIATALSPRPLQSLVGEYNWGTGLLFVVTMAGCYFLAARGIADPGRTELALITGVLANGIIAIVQRLRFSPIFRSSPMADRLACWATRYISPLVPSSAWRSSLPACDKFVLGAEVRRPELSQASPSFPVPCSGALASDSCS